MKKLHSLFLLCMLLFACDSPNQNNPSDPDAVAYLLDAPLDFCASDGSYGGYVELTWQPVEGAASYQIFRRKNSDWKKIGSSATALYRDSEVENNTGYEYCVTAVFADGRNTQFSAADSGYCRMQPPQLHCSRGASGTAITLSWQSNSGADTFVISRSASENGTYSEIATVKAASYTDTSCARGLRCWYRVKAKKSDVLECLSDAVWGCTKFEPVGSVSASKGEGNAKITLRYDAVVNATRYRVYFYNEGVLYYCGESATQSFEFDSVLLTQGMFYDFRVTALTADDESESELSAAAFGMSLHQSEVAIGGTTFSMRFNRITAANKSFMMGDDSYAYNAHKVTLTRDFHLALTEMTVLQVKELLTYAHSKPVFYGFSSEFISQINGSDDPLPAGGCSWYDAVLLCNLLTQLTLGSSCCCYRYEDNSVVNAFPSTSERSVTFTDNLGYRLPTEAEWEYACRAYSTTQFFWGDDNSAAALYARYNSATPCAAGQYLPNDFGLYDMCGNVEEWCHDTHAQPYSATDVTNPRYFNVGGTLYHCIRGGTHLANTLALSSFTRSYKSRLEKNPPRSGLRMARTVN